MPNQPTYETEYEASMYLTFAGRPFILSGKLSHGETIFKVKMPEFTLSELISGVIHMVKPGYTLQFDSPWSDILNAEIGGFDLLIKVPADKNKPTEFGFQYSDEIKIGEVLTITKLSVFARSIRDVNFNMTGKLKFLGVPYELVDLFSEEGINLLDPQGMPKPEPEDSSVFKLNFLGIGQHLELKDATTYNHVNEVVDKLKELMQPPAPGTVVPAFSEALKFNNSSQWLFAIDGVVMNTVAFKIAFNDPALYGLFLSLSGKKAKVFEGLEFEILYKKITDDLGVYQIELKLPDAIRNLEFGAVSITLPVVGIWIYTNGNFKVDLGFPYNNDFSRSFTVQALPFTGAGGFYFAVLNGSTSLTLPTITTQGSFSPVLEFGIGMNLGLGKTFNKGILSAGLTIVFYGIVEGTLGWFNSEEIQPKGTDLYYKLKGTFGIVGHIYGSVNFAIISATLDIMVYAQATITMEAAEAMLLAFEAGVSIELTVKISLGFFSIHIHLSFSATVREQFTLGSRSAAQWRDDRGLLMSPLLTEVLQPIHLKWDNLVTLDKPQNVKLYFIPFFSAANKIDAQSINSAQVQQTVAIPSLFAENNNNSPKEYEIDGTSLNTESPLTSFDKLCISILTWTINASNVQQQTSSFADLLSDQITAGQIEQLGVSLAQSDNLFNYKEIVNFIKALFVLNIIEIENRDTPKPTLDVLPLTVFPIIPDLFLTAGSDQQTIDFSTFNSVNQTYMSKVLELVSRFTDNNPAAVKAFENGLTESMATLLFRDYFQLVAKSLIQSVQDIFETATDRNPKTIKAIVNELYKNNSFNKAGGSASRFALHGLQLPNVAEGGNPGDTLKGLYQLSGQQFTMPKIEKPAEFEYSITLGKTNPANLNAETLTNTDWITFGEKETPDPTLVYQLSKTEIDRVYAFQATSFAPVVTQVKPQQIKLYKDQNRVFAFSNPIIWDKFIKTGDEKPSLWTFPSSLIAVGNSNPNILLKIAEQRNAAAERTVTPVDLNHYCYGTLLPITIKKVSNQTGEKINKSTFEVFGTDAGGIEMLTELLRADDINTVLDSITILYASGDTKALKSDDLSKLLLLLINTNLSTETNPDSLKLGATREITNTTPLDFISRLWKSSLVRTGGYYLYYDLAGETLADQLFDKNGNGEIYLLINYKAKEQKIVSPYMNVASVTNTIETSQLLFGQWGEDLASTETDLQQFLLTNQLVRNAIIKPGNIGFEWDRTLVDAKASPDYAHDLEVQYNLLNYEVLKDEQGIFKALKSVTPVGPTNPDKSDDTKWNYSKAMPINKFYHDNNQSAYIGLTKEVAIKFKWQDNYGNNFGPAIANLNYKILYFDQLVPFSAWPSLTIDYYLYKPATANTENFALTFHFVPGQNYSFNASGPDAKQNEEAAVKQAEESLKVYKEILDQIEQQDIAINFDVSLDPNAIYPPAAPVNPLKAEIIKFVNANIDWIKAFIANPLAKNQQGLSPEKMAANNYSFNCQVNPITPLDVFALSVNLSISRSPECIDPQFIFTTNDNKKVFAPGVQLVTNVVKPKLTGFPNSLTKEDKSLGLTKFAEYFEDAFGTQKFKLAATYIGEKTSSLVSTKNDELWAVRIKNSATDTGIACTVNYDQANFYAPQPHANFLFSLQDVPIKSFETYKEAKTDAANRSFNEVDSESWAINFLQSMETVLASDLSLPITMVDHLNKIPDNAGLLANLLKAKETVAAAIALQTIPILKNEGQDKKGLDLAAEKLKQQLLINLYNGYLINAVVQYRVNIESPYPPDGSEIIAPNYYGKPFIYDETSGTPKPDLQQNHSFSTAKIPLKSFGTDSQGKQESYLTYTFESKTPSLASHLKLPIQYNITHAEFNIEKLKKNGSLLPDNLNNYLVSSWLNFIIPFEAANSKLVATDIPIPLRQYPSLPVFGSQLFEPKIKSYPTSVEIKDAKLSSFSFDYTLASFVAQDSYNFEVYFNADPTNERLHDSKGLSDKQTVLFKKLAQFISVDNEFKNYFSSNLPALSKDISEKNLEELTTVIKGYGDLANEVSEAWLALYTKDGLLKTETALDVITAKFVVSEGADKQSIFQITVKNWTVSSQGKVITYVNFPEIKIGDWLSEAQTGGKANSRTFRFYKMEKGKRKYLTMDVAKGITSRSVNFKELSVLLIQNGWAGLWIERNSTLINGLQTAPEFVYATPLNRFNNPIMPSINVSNTFRVERPSPEQSSLKDYLTALLKELLVAPDQTTASASLKMLIQYKYTAENKLGDMPFIVLPIALMPPTLFTKADVEGTGESVKALTAVILRWFTDVAPSLNKGVITLSASFYSNLTGTTNSLPLLILDNIEIEVANVSDIKAG